MNKGSILPYDRVVRTLQMEGWTLVRARLHHLRLHKRTAEGLLKIVMPAHRPVKRSTLAHLRSDAEALVRPAGAKAPL